MAESEVVRVAREYREQLVRNEDEALKRMSRYWVKMERELRPYIESLYQQVKALQDSGQVVNPQLIYNLTRYQDMLAQIAKQLPGYEASAESIIADMQRQNYVLGLDSAMAQIRITTPADAIWNQVSADTAQIVAGFAGDGAPLAKLLQTDYGNLATAITDELVSGVALGKGAYATARAMRDIMGEKEFKRSVRIARTEINRAYRIGNAEQYKASGVVTKVLRLCYKPTACFACLEMDGEECKDFMCDDHPNGKCTTIAVTIGGHYPEWQKGSDWLLEQSEEDQRRIMGSGRYEMWKKDGVNPRDMVEMKPNAIWGGNPSVISEKVLRQRYNLQKSGTTISVPKSANKAQTQKTYLSSEMTEKLKNIDYRACKELAKAETQGQIISILGGGDKTDGSCASVALAYAGRTNGIDVLDFRDGKSREWFSSKINKRDMAEECGIIHEMIKDFSKTGWQKLKSANIEENAEYLVGYACHMAVVRKNGSIFEYLELQSNYRNGWHPLTAKDLKNRFGASDSGRYDTMDVYDIRSCKGDKFKEILGYLNTADADQRKGSGGTIK